MSGSNSSSSSRLSASSPPFNFKSSLSLNNYNFEQVYGDGYYVNSPYHRLQTLDADSTVSNATPLVATQPHATHDASVAISASLFYNNLFKQDECIPSHSSDYNSSQTRIMRLSGANITVPLLKPGLSEMMDSHGDYIVIDDENYSGKLLETVDSSINMEPCVPFNAKGKAVCYKKVEMVKGKEEKDGEYVINWAVDPLVITKKELLITSPDIPDLVSLGTDSGVPVHNSSELLDQNDSDEDSPCWKGTGASQSTFGVTRPAGSQFPKIETEARKTLNPLAPHFFPGSAIPRVEYHENECNGNDCLSILDSPSSVVALSSTQHSLTFSLKAGTCPTEASNVIETQTSSGIPDGGKEYALPNKANACSVINSSLSDQPLLMEDHLTSNGQAVMVPIIAGSAHRIVDNIHNGSSSSTFGVTGNVLTSSFSRDGVSSDVDEKLLVASKSTPSKLDVQLVINTIHDLSELLKWNYSNDLNSISEHDHDMIQHIINNLYMCMTNEVGQRVSIPESGHPCTSYSPRKLSGHHKEFQLTRMKL